MLLQNDEGMQKARRPSSLGNGQQIATRIEQPHERRGVPGTAHCVTRSEILAVNHASGPFWRQHQRRKLWQHLSQRHDGPRRQRDVSFEVFEGQGTCDIGLAASRPPERRQMTSSAEPRAKILRQ